MQHPDRFAGPSLAAAGSDRSLELRRRRRILAVAAGLLASVALVAGCSSEDAASTTTAAKRAPSSTAEAPAGPQPLTILVSNDDGVAAEGIDVLVKALQAMPDTTVVVSAPATNQSGAGGKTTAGQLAVTSTTMLGGESANAVAGTPADSVAWALDGGISTKPQLVVTGVNSGQNIGSLIDISGTVGAARAAATRGVPALAVSAGVNDTAGYHDAAGLAVRWIEQHRADIAAGKLAGSPAKVANLNVPKCSAGTMRGLLDVPAATTPPKNLDPVDCSAPAPAAKPTDDVAAIAGGWGSLSEISA